MPNLKLAASAKLAALFTAAMVAVNYLMQFAFGKMPSTLFAISYPSQVPYPTQTFGTSLGGTLVSWLGGYLPGFDLNAIMLLFISAFVIVLVGNLLVSSLNLPTLKGRAGRISSIILWGAIPVYLLLVGTTVPSTSAIFGVLLYTYVASWVTGWLADATKMSV
jgi:hypothetical protein